MTEDDGLHGFSGNALVISIRSQRENHGRSLLIASDPNAVENLKVKF